jgi:hypothetical protein
MTLILRKQHPEDRIEGREQPPDWSDDDYAVVDETLVGRFYRQQVQGDIKWLWFLQTVAAPLPNHCIADTLEEAKVAFPLVMSKSNSPNKNGAMRPRKRVLKQNSAAWSPRPPTQGE